MEDRKYVVLKRSEEGLSYDNDGGVYLSSRAEPVDDAVVIRTQDVFALSGLKAYGATVEAAREALWAVGAHDQANSLTPIVQYIESVVQEGEDRLARGAVKIPTV